MDILENTFYDSTVQSLFHMFSTKGAITTKEHSYQKDVHNAVLHHNLIIVETFLPFYHHRNARNRNRKSQKAFTKFSKSILITTKVIVLDFVGYRS